MQTNTKKRTKLIWATTVAVILGGTAITGLSIADQRDHGEGMKGKQGHHMKFANYRGHDRHEKGRHGHRRGAKRFERMLEEFDSNGDGKLSQAEVDQARSDRLAQFDSDGDGQLNLQEFQALWLDRMHSRMVDQFQELDEDGDAVVTGEEFLQPFAKMIERMDRNKDGELSKEDRKRRRHHDRVENDDNDDDNDDDDNESDKG